MNDYGNEQLAIWKEISLEERTKLLVELHNYIKIPIGT